MSLTQQVSDQSERISAIIQMNDDTLKIWPQSTCVGMTSRDIASNIYRHNRVASHKLTQNIFGNVLYLVLFD